jgi:hypothetical protein
MRSRPINISGEERVSKTRTAQLELLSAFGATCTPTYADYRSSYAAAD